MNARSDGLPQFRLRRYPYGISYIRGRARPWIVKFKRNKRDLYIGCYPTLDQAILAADEHLRKERNVTPHLS